MSEFLAENTNWIILCVFVVALCGYSFIITGKERKVFHGGLTPA